MSYVVLELEFDPDEILDEQLAWLRSRIEGWEPAEGNLDWLILRANAEEASVQRFHLQEMSEAAFRRLGLLFGIPAFDATRARGDTTWTMVDGGGYTIPAGTEVAVSGLNPGDDPVSFIVVEDVEVPGGSTTVADVLVEAVEPGGQGTSLTGPVQMLDALAFVSGVELQEPTSGGADAEEDAEYLNRLSDRLQLLTDRLIVAEDFSLYLRTAFATVKRALVLDTFEPGVGFDQEGHVTVVGIDDFGEPVATSVKSDAQADMEARTVTGLVLHLIDPTYTDVDVTVELVVLPGRDPDVVADQVEQALSEYLSPAHWGRDPTDIEDDTSWINTTKVRHRQVARAIHAVPGVHFIPDDALLIGLDGGTKVNEEDLDLTGDVPLTRPGAINVTALSEGS